MTIHHPNRFWWVALLIGISFDLLFWEKTPGISLAIFLALLLLGGLLLARNEGARPDRSSLLLLVPLLVFIPLTFVRAEPFSQLASVALSFGLLAVLASSWLGGRWLSYSVVDYVVNFARLAFSALARAGMAYQQYRRPGSMAESSSRRRGWAVARGLLLALPVLVIFASLLAGADLVFAERLNKLTELFRLEKLPEYLFRLFYILFLGYTLSGIYLHAMLNSRDEKLVGEDKPLIRPMLGLTEAAIVLGSLNLLFLAFVTIQFQYFFGAQANITVEGFTYSEYARRGFGELVAVAVGSEVLFLGLSAITQRESRSQRALFSGLGGLLVVLVGVILVSAFQRLMLYEAAYGFSRLRTYTHVFIIWLGIQLAAFLYLEVSQRQRLVATVTLLAVVGFGLSLNALNVDGFIARQNIARSAAGEELDLAYLSSLSSDQAPALVEGFQSAAQPALRDDLGVVLACHLAEGQAATSRPWQSYHLSRARAQALLASLDLSAYPTRQDQDGLWQVRMEGAWQDCRGLPTN